MKFKVIFGKLFGYDFSRHPDAFGTRLSLVYDRWLAAVYVSIGPLSDPELESEPSVEDPLEALDDLPPALVAINDQIRASVFTMLTQADAVSKYWSGPPMTREEGKMMLVSLERLHETTGEILDLVAEGHEHLPRELGGD